MGTLATDDGDKEFKITWELMVLREYRVGDCHEDVMRPTFGHFDRQQMMLFYFIFLVNAGSLLSS